MNEEREHRTYRFDQRRRAIIVGYAGISTKFVEHCIRESHRTTHRARAIHAPLVRTPLKNTPHHARKPSRIPLDAVVLPLGMRTCGLSRNRYALHRYIIANRLTFAAMELRIGLSSSFPSVDQAGWLGVIPWFVSIVWQDPSALAWLSLFLK